MIAPAWKSKWIDWLALAPLAVCAICLPQCHLDQGSERQEKFITVHLNDSLKHYDSVDIAILVAADTSKIIGKMWSGKLPDPSAIPSFRLDDGEDRALSIRVRGFKSDGTLIMDMLISKTDGTQTVADLPLPVHTPTDTTHPVNPNPPAHPLPLDSIFQGWEYRRIVDIRMGSLGFAKGTGVRNFPLLVRLTKQNFDFNQAGASGEDIRFSDKYGRNLAYEIARWDPFLNGKGGGNADIWVRLDTLAYTSDTEGIVMGWGNSSATSESDGSRVFPFSEGYGTVLHLSEKGRGKASEFQDATGKNPGTGGSGDGNNVPNRIDGVVGYGQDFHPLGPLVDLLGILRPADQATINLPDDFDPGPEWTVQLWVKRMDNPNAGGLIFQKGDDWVLSKQRFQLSCKTSGQVSVQRSGAENLTNAYISSSQFTHLAVVHSIGHIQVYVDGYLRDTQDWTQGNSPVGRAVLGAFTKNGDDQGFAGSMDEVWIGSMVRSPEWIRISYENQKPGSDFAGLRAP